MAGTIIIAQMLLWQDSRQSIRASPSAMMRPRSLAHIGITDAQEVPELLSTFSCMDFFPSLGVHFRVGIMMIALRPGE